MTQYYSSNLNATFFTSGSLLYTSTGNSINTSNCQLMTTGSFMNYWNGSNPNSSELDTAARALYSNGKNSCTTAECAHQWWWYVISPYHLENE